MYSELRVISSRASTISCGHPHGGKGDSARALVQGKFDAGENMWWRKGKKSKRDKTPQEVADLIERFLEERSLYPQEWNDFVDASLRDKALDVYRKRCDELDPLVNRPGEMDPKAVAELRSMVKALRDMAVSAP